MIPSLALLKRAAPFMPGAARYNLRSGVETAYRISHLVRRPAPIALRLGLAPRRHILTWPKTPSYFQVLYKVCAVNGYRMVQDRDAPHDLAVHFQYMGGHCDLPETVPVVNRHCTDVSKRHVAEVFEQVFGYGLAVDPLTHTGALVEKSDENYKHDGRILDGPLKPDDLRPGFVYQRLVDATCDGEAVDLRTPLYGGKIPLVYRKGRPLDDRFKRYHSVKIAEPEAVLSDKERAKLAEFAAAMGLDFGEMDVLRDRSDGRIYVVDVNNRPAGPPDLMSAADASLALERLAPAFARLVEDMLAKAKKPARAG